MLNFNEILALKQLVVGQEEAQIVPNAYKGSMLNPGDVGQDVRQKKQIAKPNAKIQAKIGDKYQPKIKKQVEPVVTKKIDPKYQIWSKEEVADLPVIKHDPRRQPEFQTLYRQKVGTEDVFLGLSGNDPSSNCCNEITYKIQLPGAVMKDIQIDLNQKQMVIQTKQYYLCQYFQYQTDPKKTKAKFISDKGILQLIIPVIRNDDF